MSKPGVIDPDPLFSCWGPSPMEVPTLMLGSVCSNFDLDLYTDGIRMSIGLAGENVRIVLVLLGSVMVLIESTLL